MQSNLYQRLVKNGLNQIPDDGLYRLIQHIDDGKPVVTDGAVMRKGVG